MHTIIGIIKFNKLEVKLWRDIVKIKKAMGWILLILIAINSILPITAVNAARIRDEMPKVAIKTHPLLEYKNSDTVSFFVDSSNYTSKVQYRVRIINKETREVSELYNDPSTGYYLSGWLPNGTNEIDIRFPLQGLKTGTYFIRVFVKRAGTTVSYDSYADTISFKVVNKSQEVDLKVFKNFFENADYNMDKSEFLKLGLQTDSKKAREIVKQLNDKKDISTLEDIYTWIRINLSDYIGNDMDKFSRSVEEIIGNCFLDGSGDYAIVFASLARLKGIPAVVVNSVRMDWVDSLKEKSLRRSDVGNYTFVEVLINKDWILVDPVEGIVYIDYDKNNLNLPRNCYAFSKSIEIWDTGIKYESNSNAVTRYLFRNFDTAKYKAPEYSKIAYIGNNIDPQKIKGYQLFIAPVCGDSEYFSDIDKYISIPPVRYKKVNFISPVLPAQDVIQSIKKGANFNAVIITYISGSYSSGNKAYMPDELAKYLGVDVKAIDKASQKSIYRKLIVKNGVKYLIIAAPESALILEDIVINRVDEIF